MPRCEDSMKSNGLSERMRGDRNPMRRPDVAAKISAAMKKKLRDSAELRAVVGANLAKGRDWTPERRAAARERAKAIWTSEKCEQARARQAAYQERVRKALQSLA